MTGRLRAVDPTVTAFDRVVQFADRLNASEKLADQNSMDAAEAMHELYEAGEWVDEWLTESPIKERTGGRPAEPTSKTRFAQWLHWKLESTGHQAVVTRRTYQLLNAFEVRTYLNAVQRSAAESEWAIRPLDWFRKHKLARFIPEVFGRALELADGAPVTREHTRTAVNEWKKEHSGKVMVAIRSSKSEADRIKAQGAVEMLISHGDRAELTKFNNWLADALDAAFAALDAAEAGTR